MTTRLPRVGILSRPNDDAVVELDRFSGVISAFSHHGLDVTVVPFTEETISDVLTRLIKLDGVLVWVDPIAGGRDRSKLDPLLREVANNGVWVSTHPDTILKMGTKDVLVQTREMPWGTDCFRYDTLSHLVNELPARLQVGPRVLKQYRGNGGNGVWKVELASPVSVVEGSSKVLVQHAQRDSVLEQCAYAEFITRCESYFAGNARMIDQPYQARLTEGMIRCYLVHNRVAGFGHQFVTALMPPPAGTLQIPLPKPRLYYGPTKPEFQALKLMLETSWVQEMQRVLEIGDDALPVLWDADFLYGPKDDTGRDSYVLCEINVSSVSPFPSEALEPLAAAVKERLVH